DPPPLEEKVSGLPTGLTALVRRMLAKRPEDRPQTAAEVASSLVKLLSNPAYVPQAANPPRTATTRRRWLLPIGAGALILLTAALLIGFRSSNTSPTNQAAGPISSAKAPKIDRPILFNTPEADAICSDLEVFPADNPWNQAVDSWPLHPNSAKIVATMGV